MKIMITGATGFIGWELTKTLADHGHEVVAYARRTPKELTREGVLWIKGGLNESDKIAEAIKGCQQVYHMAGLAKMRVKNPQDFYRVNVDGTVNVLRQALIHGIQKVVFTSSAGVLGMSLDTPICEDDIRIDPFSNDYDLSKYEAEQKVIEYVKKGLHAVIVNPPRVFGPGNMTLANATTQFIRRAAAGPIVAVPGNGQAVSNFVFVKDIIHGHMAAMKDGKPGERYILGGHNLSYNELIIHVSKISGRRITKLNVPSWLMKFGAALDVIRCKLTGAELTIVPADVSRFVNHRMLSSKKAIRDIHYRITDLETSLIQTLNFLGIKKVEHRNSSKFIRHKPALS